MPKILQLKAKDKQGKLRNTGCIEIKNQTETSAELYFYGDIIGSSMSEDYKNYYPDDKCPKDITDFLDEIGDVDKLDIHINSGGGSVFGGIAIYNQLKGCKAHKTVYVDGIAASIASVIACVGDGAMQMNGINALITIAKYWRRWASPKLIVLVLNNRDLNQVTWEQRVMAGDPKFPGSQELPDFPYAHYAELLGLRGIKVDHPEELGRAWDEALAADRPCVLEAHTDPEVPPLPPHITVEQARNYAYALFKGDPNLTRAVGQTVREWVGGKLKR